MPDAYAVAVSGNNLFVLIDDVYARGDVGRVGKYNATTGAEINANLITGLSSSARLAVSGNNLFVTNAESRRVGKYNATTGVAINANFITGLYPTDLAVLGNILFVLNSSSLTGLDDPSSSGRVGEYNVTTGAAINANFITGLDDPTNLAVAPEP